MTVSDLSERCAGKPKQKGTASFVRDDILLCVQEPRVIRVEVREGE